MTIGDTAPMVAVARAAAVLVLLFSAATAQDATEHLFDGRTLQGWDGDSAVWSVRDGCIVGSTATAPIAANTFLIWQGGDLADFELQFAVRLEGDNNSGVQYRSRRIDAPAFGVGGYQCDIHADPRYLGQLYEERGAGFVAMHGQQVERGPDGALRVLAQGADAGKVDLAAWHTMRIVARGDVVQHFVDGHRAIEVVDRLPTVARSGCLALQVHAGPPMTVWFKDLELRRLSREEVAATAPAATPPAGPVPQWIWDDSPQDGEEVFFRRTFDLAAVPAQAALAITCDNHFRVEVNGERVANSDDWERPRILAIGGRLRAGRNVIAVHGWNEGSVAGLCAEVAWTMADGTAGGLATDATWRCNGDDPDGWDGATFDDAAWRPAKVLGPLGSGPWARVLAGDAFADLRPDPQAFVPTAAPELHVRDGWRALRLLAVPRSMGSWVCMCADDSGRLYASDQARGLYRITFGQLPAVVGGAPARVERVEVDLDGCQGLCWAFGALYAVQNGGHSGLCRVTDSDGDDRLDHVELLRALDGNGEHGPHAVVPAPDGEHLLVLCGNHTPVTEFAASRLPRNWGEDALLARIDDPNGHAVGIRAPAGYICSVDRDGKRWELLCCGFRNAYDLAVLPSGDVVTYDADMEWDMGLPWYHPTRICHVLSGVDYGWRTGSTWWRPDWPDTLPPLAEIGPGSPTGIVAGQGGVLALDWTFGLVHQVELWQAGATLAAELVPFADGQPLPLTDVVRAGPAPDQDRGVDVPYYLLTGGRGVPSRLYVVEPAAAGRAWTRGRADAPPVRRDERVALEAFHGKVDARAVDAAWSYLGDRDAVLRYAARIAVEWQPVAQWRARGLAEPVARPWAALTALLALARQGEPSDLQPLLAALERFDFAALDRAQRTAWLRVHELALVRLGPPGPETARALGDRLMPLFPVGDPQLDADLCALLAFLEVPGLLERAMPLLEPMRPAAAPAWADVVARNQSYGGVIATMLGAMPPTAQIDIAYALRTVKNGWTPDLHRRFFAFIAAARQRKGGASYDGHLVAMRDQVWATCSAEEQRDLAAIAGMANDKTAAPAAFRATPPRGPGHAWQLAEATALVRNGVGKRDLAAGHNLFFAASCAACHRFAGEGGGVGPDLTSLRNKFRAADVLEAILEPSRVVSDQFAGSIVTRKDGSTVFGRLASRGDGGAKVYEVVTATADAAVVRVPASDVAKVEPAKLSPMPTGLVDGLNEAELLDLVAFLLSAGAR
jgi:putative heme-binding domain-containing protein